MVLPSPPGADATAPPVRSAPCAHTPRWVLAVASIFAVLLASFLASVFARGRAAYYSPATREPSAQWLRDHSAMMPDAPGVQRALDSFRFERLNASSAAPPGQLCVGVMLYRRKAAAVWSLVVSLALQRLLAARALGGGDPRPLAVPIPLAVYWVPHDAADAQGSVAIAALRSRDYDVVRVDEGIAALRKRQLADCTRAGAGAGDASSSGAAEEGSARRPTPPRAYGFALEDMRARAAPGGCAGGLLMLEDDAVAEIDWEARVGAAVVEVARRDPEWRFLKLHNPDTFNKWDVGGLLLLFLSFAALFGCAAFASSPLPPRSAAARPLLLADLARRAAASGALSAAALAVLWYAGRPLAPCVLNSNACAGLFMKRGDVDMSPSQAQLFNPRTVHAFGGCMSRTPYVTDGVCWQIDFAQHACLEPRTAAGYARLAAGSADGCEAFPRPPEPAAGDCSLRDTGLTGLWALQPSVFQHAGLVGGNGRVGILRVAERWDEAGSTLREFSQLGGAAAPPPP